VLTHAEKGGRVAKIYPIGLGTNVTKRERERVRERAMPKHKYNQPW